MKSSIMILLCAFSLSLSAQEMKAKMGKEKKWGSFTPWMTKSIGVSFVKFDGLNNRIAGFPQYKALRDNLMTLSLGTMHEKKNFISQMALTGSSSLSGDRNKQSSALRSLGASLDLGYDVIPSDMIMLYPLVGIGIEGYQAVFYKDVSTVDFNDVANSPTVQNSIRSTKFTNAFLNYRLGFGIAFKSPKDKCSIGLQAGYTGSFKDHAWKSDEYQTLNNAPVDGLQRFNISLIFAGKGMMGCMGRK